MGPSEWGDGGGLLLYSAPNRTAVVADSGYVLVLAVFATLYVAFLVVFPGIRKQRFATFTTVTLSLFVGNAILVCKLGSSWHVARARVAGAYRAFSRELVPATVGAYIGLSHVNITFLGEEESAIDFNERFPWDGADEMRAGYRAALRRGLPFPILTVAEYLSLGREGFTWGGSYRAAGYYASVLLWASLASWTAMNVLLAVAPRYGASAMAVTGALMLSAALAYHCLLPRPPLAVRFGPAALLAFSFGWSFWLTVAAGTLCAVVGLTILAIDLIYPNRFTTVLEVDYDTPYDRHIIIEDSHHKRTTGRKLEEPPGLGRRILRRLSSKKDTEAAAQSGNTGGRSNGGFELDSTAGSRWPWTPAEWPELEVDRRGSASSHASAPAHPGALPPPHSRRYQSFRQPLNIIKSAKEVPLW